MSQNSYRTYVEHRGIPAWVWALGLVTGIGVIGYLLWKYYVEPGDIILQQYKVILEDIWLETKEFLNENEAEEIYGLTAGQEAILAAKNEQLEALRPDVEKIIYGRGQQFSDWFYAALIGIVVIMAAPSIASVLKTLINKWRVEKPEASIQMMSNYGHGHLVFELIANEFAYMGKLNVASAFYYTNIGEIYSLYTAPGLNAGINYYQALLPSLIPGTTMYFVAQQMLNYMTYEVSALTGIVPVMQPFFLPMPLIP